MSSISCILLLHIPLTQSIFPSIASCSKQSVPRICPIQLVFLLILVSNMVLSSPTLRSTFSFVTLSVHLIFSIFLQHNISKLAR
uniref:Putative secreted protein n=1 Tax=Xenopsylla cheopis TaxID=163159 RepID=A0A6M2DWL7_XENCH